MKDLKQLRANLKDHVLLSGGEPDDDGLAARLTYKGYVNQLQVIASWGGGWDHVSVSIKRLPVIKARCPLWDEMCFVKDFFFHPTECVIRYHPPESSYVNQHPNCLHLWRPQDQDVPVPPVSFV